MSSINQDVRKTHLLRCGTRARTPMPKDGKPLCRFGQPKRRGYKLTRNRNEVDCTRCIACLPRARFN